MSQLVSESVNRLVCCSSKLLNTPLKGLHTLFSTETVPGVEAGGSVDLAAFKIMDDRPAYLPRPVLGRERRIHCTRLNKICLQWGRGEG